jgi:hypothetical protein
MTDFIEQELLVDSPVSIDGALSVPNGEHTLAAIGDKSAASRRLRQATGVWLPGEPGTRRGRPARIVVGDPMPEMVKLLPESAELAA